jgi:mycoredoxin
VNGGVNGQVVVFGADWCGDCRRAKSWLARNNVSFTEFDTDQDSEARSRAVELAGGRTNIPVVVLPGGAVLVEPTDAELESSLAG